MDREAIAECARVIRQELRAVHGDGRAEALCEALRACGGRALIHQISLSLDAAREGSSSDVRAGRHIQDTAWEKLHTGYWKDVHEGWRDAYSFGCLYAAEALLAASHAEPSTSSQGLDAETSGAAGAVRTALKQLDMAALMGGPLLREAVDKLASVLQGTSACLRPLQPPLSPSAQPVVSTQREGNESLPSAAAPLPPGSMENRERQVESYCRPAIEDFLMDCMLSGSSGSPAVITGAMDHWPAMERWQSLEYFRQRFGSRTVPVEVGRDYLADGWTQKLMTISEFISAHVQPSPAGQAPSSRGYLAQHPLFDQLPELRADICVPEYCSLGEGEMQSINAWFGPAGTVSPMHFDPHHNLLCQVFGRKYIRLFAPEETDKLYPFQGMNSNSSQVDVGAPDIEAFPLFPGAGFKEVVLSPGEMLYIPPRWWHFVKSVDISFSVSFWWQS